MTTMKKRLNWIAELEAWGYARVLLEQLAMRVLEEMVRKLRKRLR